MLIMFSLTRTKLTHMLQLSVKKVHPERKLLKCSLRVKKSILNVRELPSLPKEHYLSSFLDLIMKRLMMKTIIIRHCMKCLNWTQLKSLIQTVQVIHLSVVSLLDLHKVTPLISLSILVLILRELSFKNQVLLSHPDRKSVV